ncbi:MAG: endo-1,4-beta-xylanase [Prevotella sp.]|nr:endo-1,4-beta-xylanase [Prevotella sp.]
MIRNLLSIVVALLGFIAQMEAQGLKDAVGKSFLMGAALNVSQTSGYDSLVSATITNHFNCIVAENCMKPEALQPVEGKFKWRQADRFVKFGEDRGMTVIGHVLVWHAQTPDWFFKDAEGKPASRELLVQRMKTHIQTVMGRYKGRIKGWDVVNEAFEDDGTYRQSPWYQIIGPDYIELAYRFAHEADPDAELYYNDFSMAVRAKREKVCQVIGDLKKKGLRIDGIGMQSHNGLTWPGMSDYEASINAFAALGCKVMITELDMNVLPNPDSFSGAEVSQSFEYSERMDPYKNGLPADVEQRINDRWMEFFQLYKRHADQISRVCVWGVSDAQSWMNDWPISGRTAYPLLFDRQYQPKPMVREIIQLFK